MLNIPPALICRKCKVSLYPDALFCHLCGTRQAVPKRRGRSKPNGTGTVFKRGKTYTAKVVLGWRTSESGKKVPITKSKGGFKTRTEAELNCAVLFQKASEPDGPLSSKTLLDYYELYSDNGMLKLSDQSQQAYKIAWKKINNLHVVPASNLTVRLMQDELNRVSTSFDTAKDIRSLLSNCFHLMIYDGVVSINRAQALTLPENTNTEGVPFTLEELTALWKHYIEGDKFVGFILFMIYTGIMPVEFFRLFMEKLGTIDWVNKIITGIGAKTKKRKGTPVVLADAILPVLAELIEAGDELIPANESTFYRKYYESLERCGCRKLPPYSCRHTTATALEIHAKATPGVIAEVMRQKTIRMQRSYIHPETRNALAAVNLLPGA